MRLLKDGEIRAVRLGDHRGLVFLDGEQLDDVVEIERTGNQVEITSYVRDHGKFMVNRERNAVVTETWKVEADRVQWVDAQEEAVVK